MSAPHPKPKRPIARKLAIPVASKWSTQGNLFRLWLSPFGIIVSLALGAFAFLLWLDYLHTDTTLSFWQVMNLSRPEDAANVVGNIAQVLIGVMGLVITVVAIVVQLAAQRYTPRLVDLFVADRVNIAFLALMVETTLFSMLLTNAVKTNLLPYWANLVLMAQSVLIMGLLIPYFSYVFLFLTPANILRILQTRAVNRMNSAILPRTRQEEYPKLQQDTAMAMEQISDIALSAVSQMDRNVSLLGIRALRDVMVDHLLIKHRMPRRWLVPQKEHFPAISAEFLHEIHRNRTWVEIKGFMDMELIFKMSLKEMPDGVTAVANSAKVVGLYAIRLGDVQVLRTVVEFFNTFIRLAVNVRHPKAIYNLYYQYRMLAEALLDTHPQMAEKIAFYFKYYGQIAQNYNVPMILTTAAFDLAQLLKIAHGKNSGNMEALIRIFLELDDSVSTQTNEFDLRSVRKAQLNFASYLMSQNDLAMATLIFNDVKAEPKERLEAIRKEMLAVSERKFWEVTDRGVDFFYLDTNQKKHLNRFYQMFLEPFWSGKR